jgi:hypothetical protein
MAIEGKDKLLALGPYLAMGVYVGMLFGPTIIDFYLSLY